MLFRKMILTYYIMSYVIIDNERYDISKFKHPGGNVINYYKDQDATHAFREFHYRSDEAKKYLKSLKSTPVNSLDESQKTRSDLIMEDFDLFREELVDQGFFEPSMIHVVYRIMELIFIFGLGCYFIPISTPFAVLLFSIFGGRCGWVQHEGGHNSLTGNIKRDKMIQDAFIGFGLLTDSSMWNLMHNKHHATPQKIGHDMDIDTTPLVAFYDTAIEKNRNRVWSKNWLKWQAYTFLGITSGIFVMSFWIFYLHPRKIIRDGNYKQMAIVLSGHIIRSYLFYVLGGYSWYQSYLLLLVCMWGSGVYLFGHFSLSHTFTPVIGENEHKKWALYAIEHSVDINPQNPLINWIMGYLNCQVIHHLFPSMPQFRQPEVSKRLVDFCKKWDIEYNVIGYWDAWYRMLKNLNDVGNHYYNLPMDNKNE
jgi:fatty acid desaturase 2 (delta-6 desaturase)